MKNIKTPFFTTFLIILTLVITLLYFVNAQVASNSNISCSNNKGIPTGISINTLKIKIPVPVTGNATNISWLYISPDAQKELNKIISKSKKNISFNIVITGYG